MEGGKLQNVSGLAALEDTHNRKWVNSARSVALNSYCWLPP